MPEGRPASHVDHSRAVKWPMTRWATARLVDWQNDWCCVFVAEQQNRNETVVWRACSSTGQSQDFEQTKWAEQGPTLNGSSGIWCCQRDDAYHRTSVFVMFICSQFDRIHSPTSSIHADRHAVLKLCSVARTTGVTNLRVIGVEMWPQPVCLN